MKCVTTMQKDGLFGVRALAVSTWQSHDDFVPFFVDAFSQSVFLPLSHFLQSSPARMHPVMGQSKESTFNSAARSAQLSSISTQVVCWPHSKAFLGIESCYLWLINSCIESPARFNTGAVSTTGSIILKEPVNGRHILATIVRPLAFPGLFSATKKRIAFKSSKCSV